MKLEELLQIQINNKTQNLKKKIKENWDLVAKPLDGLGMFEDMICMAGAAQGLEKPVLAPRALVIICADNGIVEEGVSQSGQEVTLAVAKNMACGKSSACKMALACDADVFAVDAGINSDQEICGTDTENQMRKPTVFLQKKIRHGTRNFAAEPAMNPEECMAAITVGMELAGELAEKGYRILATGEMGIGNTTTSAAIACALLKLDPQEIAGRGAGLDDAGLIRKKTVIRKALEKYGFDRTKMNDQDAEQVEAMETFEILRTLGGLDIAGLCGLFIGGAVHHVPVVIDGLISCVAALCAQRLVPGTSQYMLASHCGREPGMKYILEELGLEAPIQARLALGEGTGALMVFPLLEMALEVYESSGSFEEIGVKPYKRPG